MRQFKIFVSSTLMSVMVAGGALAGGSTVTNGPTTPPQGVTATAPGGTAAQMANAYGVSPETAAERAARREAEQADCGNDSFCGSAAASRTF